MHRPCVSLAAVGALLGPILLAVAGCGGGGEEQIIRKYFNASRMRDTLTLGNIASVSFRPQEDGVVQRFKVLEVGEEQRRTLRLRELNAAYEEARTADAEFAKRQQEYHAANQEVIDRVLRAERGEGRLRGREIEVQQAWSRYRAEMAEHAKRVSDLRLELAAARDVAELSTFDPQTPINVTEYDGEIVSKDVLIEARVRLPSEEIVDKRYVVTMQRAVLEGPARTLAGRWIITRIAEQGG